MTEISEKATAATSSSNPSRPSSSTHSGSGSTDKDAVRPHMKPSSDPNNEKLDLTKADSAVIVPPKAENIEDHYRHLPPDEAEVLRRQVVSPEVKQGVAVLYRYASRNDILIILISALCSIAGGAALPLMTVVFGQLQGVFQDFFVNRTLTSSAFNDKLVEFVLYFVYLGIGEFIVVYISTVGFIYTGEHLAAKIREHYLESCLRQNIGFFDQIGAGEVVTRITSDTNLIQDGISEKVSLTLAAVATFVSAFIIGFIKYWKLTLILFSTVVALLINMGGGSSFILKYNRQSLEAYAHGGSLADEVISSIRNAVAFGTQERLARQYDAHLKNAEYFGFRVKGAVACMIAGMMMVLYLNYGLAFWQGSKMLVDGETSLSNILTILMAVMIGAFNLGNVAPNIQAFTNAVAAAAKIFNTIDRVSPLDSSSNEGEKLENIQGSIRLSKIKHIYPSRPEVTVMDDVSLEIPAGKVTALVGASGSGKSTIVGLVERFYDPVQGTVYLDGHDISKLNLRWLRQQMALVSQEPTLFGTTIFNNIRHGLIGTKYEDASEEKQHELVIEAAKKANAHDFVSSLPEKYETNVGERGFLLSGGQKQRIAIARAIVSDPKILLLDEATSALDTKSEGVVQAALENASEGRTTITIAHRLSTIRDAHNIVVMSDGRIVEQGTHNELLENKGPYSKLVSAQKIAAAETMTPEEQAAIDEEEVSLMRKMTSEKQAANIADPNDNIAARLDRTSTTKSASSLALQGHKAEAEQKYGLWTLIKLIASFNKKELGFMLVGLVFSAICGGGNPTQAVFFAKQITTLSAPVTDQTKHQIKKDSDFWSAMYLMLAFVQLFAFVIQGILFAKCSERLVHRVRDRAFRAMLRQDVAFFDRDENTAGALTSFLSTETTHVAGLSGVTLGTLLMVATTLIAAIALSLAIQWKLSLVCISMIPILLGCGFFRFWILAQFQRRSKAAYDSSAGFASEAISAIRTVASLTREEDVLKQYRDSLAIQQRKSLISVLKSSTLYAASQSLLFACFALAFWWGGSLLSKFELSMFQFFLCIMAIIFGAQSAGTIFSFAPDMGKAHHAAGELKKLFDRQPVVDTWSDTGDRLPHVEGTLEFRDVHFRYPTRPEQPVLRGLNLVVRPGQYIALVGASGCGKSTTIALLERFYDPLSGGVFIDGHEISTLNVNDYRSHIALVSQEPTLYQGTIRDNILLGTAREDVSDEDIEHATREANIYDFIVSLPDGFNTVVGSKGTLLSGGQKQRIAIARALIRDPKILLLDEATSALDSESEHVVQAALDKAAKGRTTIAVAHRLSTIQKADIIYVFDQGRIVEEGTHSELMKKNGRYAELVNLQSLEKQS
ncbi:ATP-binding cassette, subfamily B (MDR/TAP), member 1 [Fusarium verticillioides 7600]|uniref:ATP-binding cassette, subfamily B (MDR/TAP), member 1 n=1 Tax=Gibberella moniliformis (strain M3125 / FGSC 7600) TaxID=334819 RepID=W7LZC6_GIBM7|nr:ATP-binding cassette, subfamily B (MDR/TAP), member 1 [Fusarium verticillioides 7600]EWG43986.1 ATP-binding cassette, subfamily B (MDR/TAP), member 1 [Fusarium verticillioides 7600]